jgi:hypothetical protein
MSRSTLGSALLLALAASPALAATAVHTPGAPGAATLHKPLPKRLPLATTSLKCGSTVYVISVPAGSCSNVPAGSSAGASAICTNDGGSSASADCKKGCDYTKGDGSCTTK